MDGVTFVLCLVAFWVGEFYGRKKALKPHYESMRDAQLWAMKNAPQPTSFNPNAGLSQFAQYEDPYRAYQSAVENLNRGAR